MEVSRCEVLTYHDKVYVQIWFWRQWHGCDQSPSTSSTKTFATLKSVRVYIVRSSRYENRTEVKEKLFVAGWRGT